MAQSIVDLTQPDAAVRLSDRLGKRGQPTEPLGWDVQATHALALARAGKIDEALTENEALLNKITVNLQKGRLPDAQLSFLGVTRSKKSLWKQATLQKAILLAIAGKADESVIASSAAGRFKVNQPTEADLQALPTVLKTLAEALGRAANRNDQ